MTKQLFDTRPEPILDLGTGYFNVHLNITPITVDEVDEDGNAIKVEKFECDVMRTNDITFAATQRQLRLELLQRGITSSQIESVINQMDEPARTAALIEFNHASYFDRENPLIAQIGLLFNLTRDDLDDIFIKAMQW